MATTETKQDNSRTSQMHYCTTDKEEDNDDHVKDNELDHDDEDDKENDSHENREDNKLASGWCWPIGGVGSQGESWSLGQVLNPRAKWVQEWNKLFMLVCAVGLFVDSLFFYTFSMSQTCMCLFVNGWFIVVVTVL